MASLEVSGDRLLLRLTTTERILGVFLDEPSAPLRGVRSARRVDRVRDEIRGLRAPGLGAPGIAWIGHWRGRGHDAVAVYGNHAGVVVDLEPGGSYARFVASVDDPDATVAAIESAKTR